jgi:hypothetical protein
MRCTRFRAAGATLLITLLLSFAQAAWAATCDPDMGGMPDSSMAGMPDMDGMPGGHECPPGHGHDHDGKGDAGGDCPFAPAGGFGCAASASLPGVSSTDIDQPLPVKVLRQLTTAFLAYDLHANSIFHPPKA